MAPTVVHVVEMSFLMLYMRVVVAVGVKLRKDGEKIISWRLYGI